MVPKVLTTLGSWVAPTCFCIDRKFHWRSLHAGNYSEQKLRGSALNPFNLILPPLHKGKMEATVKILSQHPHLSDPEQEMLKQFQSDNQCKSDGIGVK